jgi:UDP-N-acetylmuramate dehydrogenase
MTPSLKRLAAELAGVADGEVACDRPLAPFTTYRIGGPTALWAAPRSEAGVQRVLQAVHAAGAPLFVLGRGSNLLVSDRGWPGVTLYIGENLSGVRLADHEAEALAGTLLMDLVGATIAHGLSGLELLSGIPGGLGGALRMNAGAFGREIESITAAVRGFTADGSLFTAARNDLSFGYRRVPELDEVVVTSARLRFAPDSSAVLRARSEDILAMRALKQPLEHPSCGSVFKRPPGYYAGALIESCGLKGEREGGAEISCKHAGFILNVGGASAQDVHRLIRRIERRVHERFGVRLEREVRLVGDFADA